MLNLAISYDRLIEGPNGELDWLVRDPSVDFGDILQDILSDKDSILYGRVSYDKWGNYRPDENASPKIREAYNVLHSKQKYVISSSKTGDGTNTIFINSNIKERITELKQQPGKNIWLYGGARIMTTLLNYDLIDEYRIAVHPVILGRGKPLFEGIEGRHRLQLKEIKPYPSGVVLETYQTKRDSAV